MPNLQASSSCLHPVCADSLDHKLCCEDEPEQGPRASTPHLKPSLNPRGDRKLSDSVTSENEAAQNSGEEMKSQCDSGEVMCKCKKPETQEAGTQTPSPPTAERQEASTQCSFVGDGACVGGGIHVCHSPVDASPPHPARRGQCGITLQQDMCTSVGEAGSSVNSPWRRQKPTYSCATSTSRVPQNSSDYKGMLQRPTKPFLNTLSNNKGKLKDISYGKEEF